jgi:hypothetical protein
MSSTPTPVNILLDYTKWTTASINNPTSLSSPPPQWEPDQNQYELIESNGSSGNNGFILARNTANGINAGDWLEFDATSFFDPGAGINTEIEIYLSGIVSFDQFNRPLDGSGNVLSPDSTINIDLPTQATTQPEMLASAIHFDSRNIRPLTGSDLPAIIVHDAGPDSNYYYGQDTIIIPTPVAVVVTAANFEYATTAGIVAFTDTSVAAAGATITGWSWDFGDGSTSTAQNPSHLYAYALDTSGYPKKYYVTLTVTDSTGFTPPAATSQVSPLPTQSAPTSGPTYVMKGFMAYGPLANNTPNVVAPFGELSGYGTTFSPDRGIYVLDQYKDLVLTTFLSATDNDADPNSAGANTGNTEFTTYTPPPSTYTTTALAVGSWIYNQAISGVLATDGVTLSNDLLGEFNGQIVNISVGPFDTAGGFSMPEWITYSQNDGTNANVIKFWLSDSAFQGQYDQYTIRVVPPVPNLDDFFQASAVVKAEIATITIEQLLVTAQTTANYQPYTIISSYNFGYLDPLNPNPAVETNFTPVPWTVLIYGVAGDNIDSVKQALVNYILANSTHNESQWAAIFPDIFNTTEFVITPLWDQYATPNLTLDQGVYSPVVEVAATLPMVELTTVGVAYTAPYVAANLSVAACTYKSVALCIVGSPTNRNGVTRFSQQFPDYMAISTSNPDFNRMTPTTQGFINLLYRLLLIAETMTLYSDVPAGFTRLVRGTIMYAVANYDNVDYLVVSKASVATLLPDQIGAPAPTPSPSPYPS